MAVMKNSGVNIVENVAAVAPARNKSAMTLARKSSGQLIAFRLSDKIRLIKSPMPQKKPANKVARKISVISVGISIEIKRAIKNRNAAKTAT